MWWWRATKILRLASNHHRNEGGGGNNSRQRQTMIAIRPCVPGKFPGDVFCVGHRSRGPGSSNRVGNGFYPSPPTPPTVRVRSGRFMQSLIRTLTGYAQDAYKAGNMGLRRTRLTRSGLIVEYRVTHCSALLHMFGPSRSATLVKYRTTTMASADFCTITPCVSTCRAVRLVDVAASFFDTQRAARHGAGSW